ncbi:hypothetical protein GHK45_24140 [Sinorhizobium meliloti]|uniref:Uncharacterized protein n=2 Tax=Rhizobium meliloti TaxID=382 RepID=A0A6A7ZVH4_RHIML|nr:hypothetical protein [Sinorhizobium meliloti]MDX0139122.1 hypothetical protein [Sinorhizobium meliloti]MDX0382353.1 hypothetical protein [Sinorhizobium meliloti]MQW06705.1 hypothetical protein [Sinorhizobium meliloti]
MADAVIANWHGHDYQGRFFWIHASGLRDPEKANVVKVSYEADAPKGFDDFARDAATVADAQPEFSAAPGVYS